MQQQQQETKYALIIIDLQNDFLESNHFCDKRGGEMEFGRSILPNIKRLCDEFRAKNHPIIWIHSVYGELPETEKQLPPDYFKPSQDLIKQVPLNNDLLSGTHNQGELTCCARNTTGIEFYKDVILIQDKEKDQFIQKQYYSAFRKTNLLQSLKDNQITDVAICGVATNYCCRASTIDAFHLGFNVHMVQDCLAASKIKFHQSSLEQISANKSILIQNSEDIIKLLI